MERARPSRIEPYARACGRLAELAAALVGQKRVAHREPEILPVARPELLADQLQAGGHVSPLVRPAHLQLDAAGAVQVQEVGGLKKHVAELGVAQPGLHTDLDRVLGQHVRDRQVLADVPQESQQ